MTTLAVEILGAREYIVCPFHGAEVRGAEEHRWHNYCIYGKMERNLDGWTKQYNNEESKYIHKMSISSCLCLVYVLSMSCLCLVYVLSMSCLCLVYVLAMSCLWLVYVLSMSCVFLVYILSMSCLCLTYVLSMSCICLVYALSMYCLCIVYILSVSL